MSQGDLRAASADCGRGAMGGKSQPSPTSVHGCDLGNSSQAVAVSIQVPQSTSHLGKWLGALIAWVLAALPGWNCPRCNNDCPGTPGRFPTWEIGAFVAWILTAMAKLPWSWQQMFRCLRLLITETKGSACRLGACCQRWGKIAPVMAVIAQASPSASRARKKMGASVAWVLAATAWVKSLGPQQCLACVIMMRCIMALRGMRGACWCQGTPLGDNDDNYDKMA